MKRRNIFSSITAILLLLALFAGCAPAAQPPAETPVAPPEAGTPEAAPEPPAEETPATEPPAASSEKIRVATLKGPTGMGMVRLMDWNENGETIDAYDFTVVSTPDEISGKLITGELDIAAAPINLAATLYNKTEGDVVMIAINTLGVLYILENGEGVQSFQDIAGKTLYATGQGATPEFILNYLLEKNGIAGDVTVEYMNDHAELATLLAAGQVDIAMLPEPQVTAALLQNDKLRVALDLTKEWDAVAGGATLVQGCVVARRELVENNPSAISNFLTQYAHSTSYANENIDETAELVAKYEIMGAAPAAKRALPNSNIVCMTGPEMLKNAQAMLQVLYDANPQSIGGKLPGEDFYYLFVV